MKRNKEIKYRRTRRRGREGEKDEVKDEKGGGWVFTRVFNSIYKKEKKKKKKKYE